MTEFISRNHEGKEYEVSIKTDNKDHYVKAIDFARKLIDQKPTNADRIRALSDEALVERLFDAWRGGVERGTDLAINWCHADCGESDCSPEKHKKCILRWLRQPAAGVQK